MHSGTPGKPLDPRRRIPGSVAYSVRRRSSGEYRYSNTEGPNEHRPPDSQLIFLGRDKIPQPTTRLGISCARLPKVLGRITGSSNGTSRDESSVQIPASMAPNIGHVHIASLARPCSARFLRIRGNANHRCCSCPTGQACPGCGRQGRNDIEVLGPAVEIAGAEDGIAANLAVHLDVPRGVARARFETGDRDQSTPGLHGDISVLQG